MYRFSLQTVLAFSLLMFTGACAEHDPASDLVELDLLSEGLPIVIKAPEGAIVEKMDLVIQQDVTVRKGDDYYVQIYVSDMLEHNKSAIKSRLLREVQGHRYYQKIVEEDETGFIYQNAIDSTYINYGFRRFRLQGDKEYVFQTGLQGKYTLDQVKKMYEAVK